MTVLPVGPEWWRPARGDYGKEYLTEVVTLIEETNCAKGCARAGGPGEIARGMTPSGSCPVMAGVILERPVREIDPLPDGPLCTARQPLGGGQ